MVCWNGQTLHVIYHTLVWFSVDGVFNIEKKHCCGTMSLFPLSWSSSNKGAGVVLIVISVNLFTTKVGFLTTLHLCILSSAMIFLKA